MSSEFSIHRDALQGVLNRAISVVPTSGQSLGAHNFLMSVDNDLVKVTSTDEKVGYRIFSNAKATSKFEFQVPAKKLHSIARRANLGEVQFEVSDGQMRIISGGAHWDLHLINGSFPSVPRVKGKAVKIDREALLEAIAAISSSVAKDLTRPYLRMISVRDGKATACDGVRFQQIPFASEIDFQVPLHAIPHLTKFLASLDSEKLNLRCSSDAVSFESVDGKISLVSKNLATRFPDVEQMMLRPALENKSILTVSRVDFIRSVERVRLNEDADTSAVGLKLDSDCLTVTARDRNLNAAYDTLPASWKGKDRVLVVNSGYLLELLRSVKDTSCTFYLGEDTRARKSLVMLKSESGAVGLLPQMSLNTRMF